MTDYDNPFQLKKNPSDPSSWIYVSNGANGYHWIQATLWSPIKTYAQYDHIVYNTNYYFSLKVSNQGHNPNQPNSVWWSLTQFNGPWQPNTCTASYQGAQSDPFTGTCEKSALNDPCVNPCIRLPSGSLKVNQTSSMCRVFPTTTSGGTAQVGTTFNCPTVCPSACVELWETCPEGTGPLVTLSQSKSPVDVLALTGPYQSDGHTVNPLFPLNYLGNYNDSTTSLAPLNGKPYTECYAFNTAFCELPNAWQETTLLGQFCYSNCPVGTIQDPTNRGNCLFLPIDTSKNPFDPTQVTYQSPLNSVYCNPQYFNPLYFSVTPGTPGGGVQKGCSAKPLPTKQGSSCPYGTLPYVNDFFSLEWCMPDCPSGFVQDLFQTTCIATCEATYTGQPTFNSFLDYVEFYAISNKCAVALDVMGNLVEKKCIQNETPGRCHLPFTVPSKPNPNSLLLFDNVLGLQVNNAPLQNINVKYSSIDLQGPKAMNKSFNQTEIGLSNEEYKQFLTKYSALKEYQESFGVPDGSLECPEGMVLGNAALGLTNESQNLCYDTCADGYEPISYCPNGALQCTNYTFACRSMCPAKSEGLGPWIDTPDPGCAYQYPNNVIPADPNLWNSCPDDGRYYVQQSNTNDIQKASSSQRNPPVCLKKTYLRQITCPNNYNILLSKDSGGPVCSSACNSDEAFIKSSSNVYTCSTVGSQSENHSIDLQALADSNNASLAFKNKILKRKNFSKGFGVDPNQNLPSTPSTSYSANVNSTTVAVGSLIGLVSLGLLTFNLFKKK